MKENRYDEFEAEYRDKAKKFLYQEIAIRFGVPFDKIEEFVNNMIERNLKEF